MRSYVGNVSAHSANILPLCILGRKDKCFVVLVPNDDSLQAGQAGRDLGRLLVVGGERLIAITASDCYIARCLIYWGVDGTPIANKASRFDVTST